MQPDKHPYELLTDKPAHTLMLFDSFIEQYKKIGDITVHPAKTMIGIANAHKRIAYVIQLGKNFIDVVFMFKQPYNYNLCFRKIAQVPGEEQYNHHLRMYEIEDMNEEVAGFMRLAYEGC
ncbi:MAG: DUF5655 domain-containing protein [Mucilaginibacter sp.]